MDDWVVYNAAGLFNGNGKLVSIYRKVNLLPFGERIPFSQYLPLLGRLEFGQANFRPGSEPTIFESSAGTFGVLICFESTFANYTRNYVRNGAGFLVNITNDGWFGSRTGPLQHVESAVVRAVENRVSLVRAANTGVSLQVDPAGRILRRIDLDIDGAISARLYRPSGMTFFTRYGHVPFLAMALLNLIAVAAANLIFRGD
jgi:apolipoprotein N-acyltransferase